MSAPAAATPLMVTKAKYDELASERDRFAETLETLASAADWYRRCLEDVADRRPVRGLDEARAGYDNALDRAFRTLARTREG